MGFQGSSNVAVTVSPTPIQNNVTATTPADLTTTNVYGARLFGNGADGSVIVSTTVGLTRDMQYTDLTVVAGGTLVTNGWKVMVSGTLTVEAGGFVHNDGNTGVSGSGGAGGAGGTFGAGGNGGTGNAAPGAAPPQAGAAGFVGGGSGGGVGTGNSVSAGGQVPPFGGVVLLDTTNLTSRGLCGGGGGGAGNLSASGGGGGAGVVCLCADTIINNGTIRARGGTGYANTSNLASGAGGGGGIVALVYRTYRGAAPSVVGGLYGGPGAFSGTAGRISEVIVK